MSHRGEPARAARNGTRACRARAARSPPSRWRRSTGAPQNALDVFARHAARPQDAHAVAKAGHDGGLDADRARPAINDEIDAAVEFGRHVIGACRAHAARAVGGGRGHGDARFAQDGERHGVGGHAQRDAVEARARQQAHGAAGARRRDDGEGTGPERLREREGVRIEHGEALRGVGVRHVRDQRVEARALLGGVDARHRRVGTGVRAEPVDGLGREGDEPALPQDAGGVRGGGRPRRHAARRPGRGFMVMQILVAAMQLLGRPPGAPPCAHLPRTASRSALSGLPALDGADSRPAARHSERGAGRRRGFRGGNRRASSVSGDPHRRAPGGGRACSCGAKEPCSRILLAPEAGRARLRSSSHREETNACFHSDCRLASRGRRPRRPLPASLWRASRCAGASSARRRRLRARRR